MDLFGNAAAILSSVVWNSYYGMLSGQISMHLSPKHPIVAFWNSRVQNGLHIAEKVHTAKL